MSAEYPTLRATYELTDGTPLACPIFPTTQLAINMTGDALSYEWDADVQLVVGSQRAALFAHPTREMRSVPQCHQPYEYFDADARRWVPFGVCEDCNTAHANDER